MAINEAQRVARRQHPPDPRRLRCAPSLAATSFEEEVCQVILNPALEAIGAGAATVLVLEGGQLRAVAASGEQDVVSLWQTGPLSVNSPTADAINSGLL